MKGSASPNRARLSGRRNNSQPAVLLPSCCVSLLVSAYLVAFPSVSAAQTEWQTLRFSSFDFYYTSADLDAARKLSTIVENEYHELSAKLGLDFQSPVRIFLSPSDDVFNEVTGNRVPHWGEGVADLARNMIVLKSPGISGNYNHFPKLVRHELTHVLIGQAVHPAATMPRWFNEGLAIYYSNDEQFAPGAAISKALVSNSIIPLGEIDNVLQFHKEKARLAYEQSGSLVIFLEESVGRQGLVTIVKALREGQRFDAAFVKLSGQNLIDFEWEWLQHIEKKYRWRFLLDFETYIWIFMLLLFIFVFIAIKIRNRKTLKRWDEEEGWANP